MSKDTRRLHLCALRCEELAARSCSLCMASILHLLLKILHKLHFPSSSIRHGIKRWALFLVFLGRKLGMHCLWNDGKRVTSHKPTRLFSLTRTETRSRSESEDVVAASRIPASASHPSLHDLSTVQAQTTTSSAIPPASLTAEPNRDHALPLVSLNVGIHSNRSIANLSTHSRASDRLSIIQTHSRESIHAPRFPRAPHHQFGRGPSPSPSVERPRPSRSPSPTNRISQLPRLEIDDTHLRSEIHGRESPINPPSVTSHANAPLSPPSLRGHHRRQSSTSVMIVGVENPSTESLGYSADQPPYTEEPHTIGLPTSPSAHAPEARADSPHHSHSPTASSSSLSATSNFDLPPGRLLQLINSEQVPRYTKEIP